MKTKANYLYAPDIPPFNWYVNYLGKPLYKTARKMGFSEVGALAVANIPGSLAHTPFQGDISDTALVFMASEIVCTSLFYGLHKLSQHDRKQKLNLSDKIVDKSIENIIRAETIKNSF